MIILYLHVEAVKFVYFFHFSLILVAWFLCIYTNILFSSKYLYISAHPWIFILIWENVCIYPYSFKFTLLFLPFSPIFFYLFFSFSGGTAAGLAIGIHLSKQNVKIHAIGVCDTPQYFYNHINEIGEKLGLKNFNSEDIITGTYIVYVYL